MQCTNCQGTSFVRVNENLQCYSCNEWIDSQSDSDSATRDGDGLTDIRSKKRPRTHAQQGTNSSQLMPDLDLDDAPSWGIQGFLLSADDKCKALSDLEENWRPGPDYKYPSRHLELEN